MKPFLRWAGSKKQLLPILAGFWDTEFTRYVEPFAGSAVLFFHLQPGEALLADLNKELMRTYNAIKIDVGEVIHQLKLYSPTRNEYYRVRDLDPTELPNAQAAARFIYLNRLCFNGLFRLNARGGFNVPFGRIKGEGLKLDEQHLHQVAAQLRNATLLHADFEKTIELARAGDFVYLDPPYVVSKRRVFREYTAKPFSNEDLQRLGASLDQLDRVRAAFVVTYADSTEARKLLRKWRPLRLRVRRNIAGFAGHRRLAYELLATNVAR